MCGNVQLGASLSSFLKFIYFFNFFVFRPDLLTAEDSGTKLSTFRRSSVLGHFETLTVIKPTGWLEIWTFFSPHFLFFSFARSQKKEKKKKGFKCECFFWKGSSVVSEDAVQF